jgi:hypothetical protein
MTRLIPLAAVALALGACSTPPQQGGPGQPRNIVTNVHPYTPGTGVIQAVYPTPGTSSSAAAGGTAEPLQRLEIKMDNGKVQYVDTSSREFTKGQRVMLTQDRYIKKA